MSTLVGLRVEFYSKSEKEFDEILEKFVTDRNAMGFSQLQEKRYKYVESAKEKLGIE